jgi:hypothetical protein
MKSAVINIYTTVVENIIAADPSDPCPFSNTFLVLVPEDLPVNIGFTYIEPSFYDSEGNIVTPISEETPTEEDI